MSSVIGAYAKAIASAIVDVVREAGDIEIGDVEWGRRPVLSMSEAGELVLLYHQQQMPPALSLSAEARRAIVFALKPDLYIEPAEEADIRKQTKFGEAPLVNAVLGELRENPPLVSREKYLRDLLGKPSCSYLASLVRDCVTESEKKAWRREIREKMAPVLARIKTK